MLGGGSLGGANLSSPAFRGLGGSALNAGAGGVAILLDDYAHPAITFTRASSKTYFDKDGILQTAATDVWPVEYQP